MILIVKVHTVQYSTYIIIYIYKVLNCTVRTLQFNRTVQFTVQFIKYRPETISETPETFQNAQNFLKLLKLI